MADILDTIIAHKRVEVEESKNRIGMAALEEEILRRSPVRSMKASLASSPVGIIAEFKRRSPSKGDILGSADASIIPLGYEASGASALSILTDRKFFGGTPEDVRVARPLVSLPILRKEFVVDEYHIYEARAMGADAVLLIASALDVRTCRSFAATAHSIGLEVLLEIHDERELEYLSAEVDMVGVNNRHLGSFITDVATSFALADLLPRDLLRVSESGLSSPETVKALRSAGYRGFLMGERFMRESDPPAALRDFVKGVLS